MQSSDRFLSEIYKKVRQVKFRINLNLYTDLLFRGFFYSLSVLCAFYLAHKLFYLELNIYYIFIALLVCSTAGAVISAYRQRCDADKAARQIDSDLKLKERISSALLLRDADRPFVGALISDAYMKIGSLQVNKTYRMKKPLYMNKFLVSALVLCLIHFSPDYDLLKRKEAKIKRDFAKKTIAKEAEIIKKNNELLKKNVASEQTKSIDEISKELDALAKDLEKADDQKSAFAKISKLEDDIKFQKNELNDKLKDWENLNLPAEDKFTNELAEALNKMELKTAAEEIDKLKEKLKSGNLSEEDKQKLKEELENLSKQLANNKELSEQLKKMAESLLKGDMKELEQQMGDLSEQMSDLAEALKEMQTLDKIKDDLEARKAALAKGENSGNGEGEDEEITDGTGGKGHGRGGKPPINSDAKTDFTDTKIASPKDKGKIIGMIPFMEKGGKAESTAEMQEVFFDYKQQAEDTLSKQVIPATYKNKVRKYFDSINPNKKAPDISPEKESGVGTIKID